MLHHEYETKNVTQDTIDSATANISIPCLCHSTVGYVAVLLPPLIKKPRNMKCHFVTSDIGANTRPRTVLQQHNKNKKILISLLLLYCTLRECLTDKLADMAI